MRRQSRDFLVRDDTRMGTINRRIRITRVGGGGRSKSRKSKIRLLTCGFKASSCSTRTTVITFDGLAIIMVYFVVRGKRSFVDTTQESGRDRGETLLGIVHILLAHR